MNILPWRLLQQARQTRMLVYIVLIVTAFVISLTGIWGWYEFERLGSKNKELSRILEVRDDALDDLQRLDQKTRQHTNLLQQHIQALQKTAGHLTLYHLLQSLEPQWFVGIQLLRLYSEGQEVWLDLRSSNHGKLLKLISNLERVDRIKSVELVKIPESERARYPLLERIKLSFADHYGGTHDEL